jgi:hypothetical protein
MRDRAAGRLLTDFVAPAARRNSSFGLSGKPDIDWFGAGDPRFRRRPTEYDRAAAATSSPARHFGRDACRYVETSHAVAGPDHKAAQLPAFFLRFVGPITCEARHPCVVKTS